MITNISSIFFKRKNFDIVAMLVAVFGIFFIPVAPKMVNLLFPMAVVCTVAAGDWQHKWQVIKSNKISVIGGLLLLLFLIGTTYNLVPLKFSLQGLFKYTKIAYLFFLLPLFVEPKWQKNAIFALFGGVLVNALIASLSLWHVWGLDPTMHTGIGGYFVHPIYTSVLTAFSLFALANFICDAKQVKFKVLYAIVLLFGCYTLFFVYIERTGYVIAFALLVLFLWQRWQWRGIVASLLALSLLAVSLAQFSPVFQQRLHQGINDVQQYQQNQHATSWGYRFDFAKYSFKVIKQRPILGSGTGSFPLLYKNTGGPVLEKDQLLGHPHNEYILITFQLGIVGLLVFLSWILTQWRESFKLPLQNQRLAQGLILTFVLNSFCNASLYINATGMFYVVFLAVFFGAHYFESKRIEQ